MIIETEQEFAPLAQYLKLSEIADELSGSFILNFQIQIQCMSAGSKELLNKDSSLKKTAFVSLNT